MFAPPQQQLLLTCFALPAARLVRFNLAGRNQQPAGRSHHSLLRLTSTPTAHYSLSTMLTTTSTFTLVLCTSLLSLVSRASGSTLDTTAGAGAHFMTTSMMPEKQVERVKVSLELDAGAGHEYNAGAHETSADTYGEEYYAEHEGGEDYGYEHQTTPYGWEHETTAYDYGDEHHETTRPYDYDHVVTETETVHKVETQTETNKLMHTVTEHEVETET